MRFMVLMYPGAKAESGRLPDEQAMAAMMSFNEMLAKSGAMLAADGLRPSKDGARITRSGGKPKVTDGPFAESKELLGGFWMIQAPSKAEAVRLFSSCPIEDGERIELRQVYEMSDFAIDEKSDLGAQVDRVSAAIEQNNRA